MRMKFLNKLISALFILGATNAYAINYFDDGIEYWPDEKKN